ncbi:MAG: 23S rRNA (uracil(1939)-C(5))-methyltransferase RlmD [Ruminiclostridium sp.]|nr:23S rRNA (uracil(1939)-C(5))-methyltransferase RlmD [Ruminiclostridium sp.]
MLEKNKNHLIDITGMTHEGQGVGRIEGFAVFVDGALEGERVEIKIVKVNKNFGFGKLVNIIKPSGNRIEPFCEAFKHCGGCSLQHLDYQGQLDYKDRLVKDNLKRIGKLENVIVHNTIGMKEPLNYRNKAQFPVASEDGTVITGFYARRTHDVIDSAECGIQDKSSDRIRKIIRGFIEEKNISVYDEKTGKGLLRHIMTRVGFRTGEVMVVIVINGSGLPFHNELVTRLIAGAPEVKSIFLNINTGDTNVILGNKNVKVYGNDTITDYIGKYKFHISPLSFFQVNPVQTEVLYTKALEYADLTGNETVFDLYCGIGTISLFMSQKARKVYGVEVVEDAVRDARRNAEINGVGNIEFVAGEAEKIIPGMYERGIRADVVVVDPPRKGCDETLLGTLTDMQPDRIVYVSCNPATLARDLNYLEKHSYKTVEVQPVDMFPWTMHVECVIMMTYCGLKGK